MTITSQVGAICYRQSETDPRVVERQDAPGKRWVWHCDCATAAEAARLVLRLGRGEKEGGDQ